MEFLYAGEGQKKYFELFFYNFTELTFLTMAASNWKILEEKWLIDNF